MCDGENLLRRCYMTRVDNSGKVQKLQVKAGRGHNPDDVLHLMPFGYDFIPLSGDENGAAPEGLMIRGQGWDIVLPVMDRRHRDKSGAKSPGDVSVYSAGGGKITCKMDGTIEADAPSDIKIKSGGKVEVEAATSLFLKAVTMVLTADNGITLDSPIIHLIGALTGTGPRPTFGTGETMREVAFIGDEADVTNGSSQGRWEVVKDSTGFEG